MLLCLFVQDKKSRDANPTSWGEQLSSIKYTLHHENTFFHGLFFLLPGVDISAVSGLIWLDFGSLQGITVWYICWCYRGLDFGVLQAIISLLTRTLSKWLYSLYLGCYTNMDGIILDQTFYFIENIWNLKKWLIIDIRNVYFLNQWWQRFRMLLQMF